MDTQQPNHLIQRLQRAVSRRGALRLMAGGLGPGAMLAVGADAKKKRHKRKKRKALATYHLVTRWDVSTVGENDFPYPHSLALFGADTLFVGVGGSVSQIHKYTTDGQLLTWWGGEGDEDHQFHGLRDIAVDKTGNVYATDVNGHQIKKFDGEGDFLTKWGGKGSANGQFEFPTDIAIDGAGNVFVADPDNARVQKFDGSGEFLTSWGKRGRDDGEFSSISDIALDAAGNVYVGDEYNQNIQLFDNDGGFLAAWGQVGEAIGKLHLPLAAAIGPDGAVFVSDYHGSYDQRLLKFRPNGALVAAWRSDGSGRGANWDVATGLAVGSDGLVYVGDAGFGRILIFAPS